MVMIPSKNTLKFPPVQSPHVCKSSSLRDHALAYINSGFRVFPLKKCEKKPLTAHGLLDATTSPLQVNEYWSKWPEANIGIVTDGLIVIDFDESHGGLESKLEIEAKYGPLPRTRVHRTGGGGEHWIYRQPPGSDIRNTTEWAGNKGVDRRANGGYIVAPPSLHPSGNYYEVLDDSPIAEAPQWLLQTSKPLPVSSSPSGDVIEKGNRNQTLTRIAGVMRNKGMSEDAIQAALMIENNKKCNPPLEDSEVIAIAHSIARYEPAYPVTNTADTVESNYIIIKENGSQSLDQDKLQFDLMSEFYFKTLEDTGQVLIYRDGVYQYNGEQFIRAECQRRIGLRSLLTEHRVNEIVGHIRRSTFIKRSKVNKPGRILNLRNGLIDTKTRILSSHTPEFISTVQLPISYQPSAKGERIRHFLTEILNPTDVPLIIELFGFCMLPVYQIQKAFLLVGDGANGKSTLLKLIIAFIGEENCSHVSWHQLELNRFAMADLEGKLVNSFADLPSRGMSMTTAFKMLTGGDSICAERKFMPSFNFVNFAKLVFSTNKPPKVEGEDSFAFWRRWIIIEFPNTFTGKKDNPNLIDELTTDEELSGLLNMALDGLDRLYSNRGFSYSRSVDETSEYYLRAADPVYAFIQDCCEVGTDYWISKDDCYVAFKDCCASKQIPLLRPNAFGRSLQNQTSVRITPTRPQVGESRVQAWQGLKLMSSKTDGGLQKLTEPLVASGMSGQNDTSKEQSNETNNIILKLQKNPDIPDGSYKTAPSKTDGDHKNSDGSISALLGMSLENAMSLWNKHGAPVIHVAQAVNCFNLEVFVNNPNTPAWQIEAIKKWLKEHP